MEDCKVKHELFSMCGSTSVSDVYWDLHNEINLDDASADRVAAIIETDPKHDRQAAPVSARRARRR